MEEKEFIFDGLRTLGLFGSKYIITYNAKGQMVVLEKEVFNGINGFRVFDKDSNLATEITTYLRDMNLEKDNKSEAIVKYLASIDKILEYKSPINRNTWKKVVRSDVSTLSYYDLGIGKIACYSNGELELLCDTVITLGNIEEVKDSSVTIAKDLIRDGIGVCHGVSVEEIANGIRELYQLYAKHREQEKSKTDEKLSAKPIATAEPVINNSREMVLCTIAYRATQLLTKGNKWLSPQTTARDLYQNVYLQIYNDWIASRQQFSLQFIDNKLNAEFFKQSQASGVLGVAK